jgi:diaminohydroxyphosphoribosylaminopyrimidine deaminase/5-amino-6-(5-phosphoribosylamino)uracil reductase
MAGRSSSQADQRWMMRAMTLAQKALGDTKPNPPVGAVIVKNGRIIGEGYHRKAGTPHAEVHAIRQAGSSAKNASLYVTLEPCSSHGRTPPCTDLIIKSGISRIVIGTTDPDPRHQGLGIRILKKAGLVVATDVCKSECEDLIEPFSCRMTTGLPFVTLKLGMSMDGYIADSKHDSQWITGPAARKYVQTMRRKVDAILVGTNTAKLDDPSLRCRTKKSHELLRIIIDRKGALNARSQVFTDDKPEWTIMAVSKACNENRKKAYLAAGARVWTFGETKNGLTLKPLLKRLASSGVMHVLCEGGGELAGQLVKQGLVNEIQLFIAPILLGNGVPAFKADGWSLAHHPDFKIVSQQMLGKDLLLKARPCAKGE